MRGRPLISYDKALNDLDVFMLQYGIHQPRSVRKLLVAILRSKYDFIVEGVDKIKTGHSMEHNTYMQIARILHEIGYSKQGHWFVYQEEIKR